MRTTLLALALFGCNSQHEMPVTECLADGDCAAHCDALATQFHSLRDAGVVTVYALQCRGNACYCVMNVDGSCRIGWNAGQYSCTLSADEIVQMCIQAYGSALCTT